MSDLDTILRKIRALREKTIAAGCTEYEAIAAATAAARMMAEHGLVEDDVEMDLVEVSMPSHGRSQHQLLWGAISAATSTAVLLVKRRHGGFMLRIIGQAPGPQLAEYLLVVTDRAIDGAVKAFRKSDIYRRKRLPKTKATAVASFRAAMINRLGTAILSRMPTDQARLDRAKATLDRIAPDATAVRPPRAPAQRDERASNAGWVAGGKVGLHDGVGRDATGAPIAAPPKALTPPPGKSILKTG